MGRRFTRSQRSALWRASDGRCEGCGMELERGWHADHVHPWSAGGPTDVSNGAALCPECNRRKGSKIIMAEEKKADPRAVWQSEAIESFLGRTGDFLVTACPGAGKTRMALGAARALLDAGQVERVIVVVPTQALRRQWSKHAAQYRLDLSTDHSPSQRSNPATHGFVATYQQVGFDAEGWRIKASRKRTLVVFDEIHHASDESTWGKAVQHAFEVADRRLLLSGTPFRTDGTRIPFVEYDTNGMSVSHHAVTYGEGVQESIVRPIRFMQLDGSGRWLEEDGISEATLDSVKEKDRSKLLRTLFAPRHAWIANAMRKADDELTRIREEMPDAAGLVVAAGKPQAEAYEDVLRRISGETPVVVHSDLEGAADTISQFAQGTARWIIAVDMVSEGVDIPRLAVGVYASMKKTELWFRQVVGRFIRIHNDDSLTSTLFIPDIADLVDMAQRIEGEAAAGLVEMEREASKRSGESRTLEIGLFEPLAASGANLSGAIMSGQAIEDEEIRRALELQGKIGRSLSRANPADIALLMRELGHPVPTARATVTLPAPASTAEDERRALRKQLGFKVGQYCRLRPDIEHKDVWGHLVKTFGQRVDEADANGLRKRLELVDSWIEKAQR